MMYIYIYIYIYIIYIYILIKYVYRYVYIYTQYVYYGISHKIKDAYHHDRWAARIVGAWRNLLNQRELAVVRPLRNPDWEESLQPEPVYYGL